MSHQLDPWVRAWWLTAFCSIPLPITTHVLSYLEGPHHENVAGIVSPSRSFTNDDYRQSGFRSTGLDSQIHGIDEEFE
jgi:hypothetical protein